MKIKLIFEKKSVNEKHYPMIKKFIRFLYKKYKLKSDLMINFLGKRKGRMTTGGRLPNGLIVVLCGKRIIRDILRTLAHEWVHEFQYQRMGLKDTQKIQDIGGPEENMCNILSGIFVKKFEKEFPQYSHLLYGEN